MRRPLLSVIIFIAMVGLLSYWMGNLTTKALSSVGLPDWLFTLLFLLLLLAGFKRILVNSVAQEIDIKPTVSDYHPWLDVNMLAEMTAAFESMGFEWQGDYSITLKSGRGVKGGFFKLFIHPEHMCFAEATQVIMVNDTTVPMYAEVTSLLSGNRHVSTIARKPNASSSLIKHPSAAVVYSKMNPSKLMQAHLQQRSDIINQCNVKIIEDLSPEAYFCQQCDYLRDITHIFKRKSMFVLPLELIYYSMRPISEWRGKRVCKPDGR